MDLSARISFNARVFLHYQGFGFQSGRNDCDFLQAGVDAGLALRAGKNTRVSLSYGDLPYEMRSTVSDFLEDQPPGSRDLLLGRRQP